MAASRGVVDDATGGGRAVVSEGINLFVVKTAVMLTPFRDRGE